MMQDKASSPFGLVLVLVLVAVLLLLQAGYMLWRSYRGPAARRIEKRLYLLSAAADKTQQARLLKERMLSDVPMLSRWLLRMPRLQGLDQLLVQAGLDWTVSRLLLGCATLGLACLALMWLVLAQPFALALFLALFLRSTRVASRANDAFPSLVAFGLVSAWFVHVIVNVGMTLSLMPVTGIPLPFFSYGGSFLLVSWTAVAVLLRISAEGRGEPNAIGL